MNNKLYKVNDIFYSLQGEGHNAGRAALFVRFSGCNLSCPFCDTDFSDYKEMTSKEILMSLSLALSKGEGKSEDKSGSDVSIFSPLERTMERLPLLVLTGGEPTLQVDASLIDLFHDFGFYVAMESNGTHEPPANLDWLTVSPKCKPEVKECSELKVLFDGKTPVRDYGVKAQYYYLQPLDTGDAEQNKNITAQCVEYIKKHPCWRLSLQMHKLIGIK